MQNKNDQNKNNRKNAVFNETVIINSSSDSSFDQSLKKLRASDIKSAYKGKPQKVATTAFFTRFILMMICISVFAYSVYSIADDTIASMKAKDVLDEYVNITTQTSEVSRIASLQTPSPMDTLLNSYGNNSGNQGNNLIDDNSDITGYDPYIRVLETLKADNSDVYGWIRVSGCIEISYPILKSYDNDYYLNRGIDKKSSKAGSIFTDYRNSSIHSENRNTVFYGHCMTNGTMFGKIKTWFDAGCKNPGMFKIEIITLDKVYIYELFAAYRSEGAHFVTVNFQNEADYKDFLSTIKKKSTVPSSVSYSTNSRVITLSTCTNVASKPNERFVVHGILKSVINL